MQQDDHDPPGERTPMSPKPGKKSPPQTGGENPEKSRKGGLSDRPPRTNGSKRPRIPFGLTASAAHSAAAMAAFHIGTSFLRGDHLRAVL
jgi:hypothetical protein